MIDFRLHAKARDAMGKGANRRLRRANRVPAVLYGAGGDAQALFFDHDEIMRQLAHEAFYSHVLTVEIDGREEKAVLKDLQRHPSRPVIQHLDLQRVSATEKIRMRVPLHFIGADIAPGVKLGGGVVSHLIIEAEVICLPGDLPEYLEIDISALDIGDSVHLSGITLPERVELAELAHGPEHDLAVVNIHKPRTVEVEVAPAGDTAPAAG